MITITFEHLIVSRPTLQAAKKKLTTTVNGIYGFLFNAPGPNFYCHYCKKPSLPSYTYEKIDDVTYIAKRNFRVKYACMQKGCRCKVLNPGSHEFLINCHGLTINASQRKLKEKGQKTLKTSLERGVGQVYSNMNGPNNLSYAGLAIRGMSLEDSKKFLSIKNKKSLSTRIASGEFVNPFSKEYHIKNGASEEEAQELVNRRNFWTDDFDVVGSEFKGLNPARKKYWKFVHGDQWESIYSELCEKRKLSVEKFIAKYGEDLGREKYDTWTEAISGNLGMVSREESKFCFSLYRILRKMGHARDDLLFYCKGNRQLALRPSIGKRAHYDFVIESIKVIIEYNGDVWHPRPERMSKEKWDSYVSPFSKVSAQECYDADMRKHKIAHDFGYEIHEVWSSQTNEERISSTLNFIKGKLHAKDQVNLQDKSTIDK